MPRLNFERLRETYPLADVLARLGIRVPPGNRALVSCLLPGHDDEKPSMSLRFDPEHAHHSWHCFSGCGHGDAIRLIARIYGVGDREAVAMLETPGSLPATAQRDLSGITVSPSVRGAAEAPDLGRTSRELVLAALNAAWSYYTFGSLHDAALDYLHGRGIDVRALEGHLEGERVVGHTPFKAPDQLTGRLRAKGFTDDELVDAGLARRSEGRVIDVYRYRVIIPVGDAEGRVVGLIGRYARERGDIPRYINPARTVVYDKSVNLYRPCTRQLRGNAQVVLVEGTLDALAISSAAAEAGRLDEFAAVTASGLGLSDSQWDQILALHDRAPVIAVDGDQAGHATAARWAAAAADRGRETAVTSWPPGHDPASYLAAYGPEGLGALTREGCLHADPSAGLRPHHGAVEAARQIIGQASGGPDQKFDAAIAPTAKMSRQAAVRYATYAAEVIASLAVEAAAAATVEAGAEGRARATAVIQAVAVYGTRLPESAQGAFAERAACEIERANLGPAGWAQRTVQGHMTALNPSRQTFTPPPSVEIDVGDGGR
jgi:DNA primase